MISEEERSQGFIQTTGIAEALGRHVRKVYEIVKEQGNETMIVYQDILMKYPSVLKQLRKEIVIMYWDYVPKTRLSQYPKNS